jgi:hypothetical protein
MHEHLGEREPELADEMASFVRDVLDPQGERTGLLRRPDDDDPSRPGPPRLPPFTTRVGGADDAGAPVRFSQQDRVVAGCRW